jgi:hypothetical protein
MTLESVVSKATPEKGIVNPAAAIIIAVMSIS